MYVNFYLGTSSSSTGYLARERKRVPFIVSQDYHSRNKPTESVSSQGKEMKSGKGEERKYARGFILTYSDYLSAF